MIINKQYLLQYSPLPSNYQVDELLNYVNVAEKTWIVPVLGEELYEDLQQQIDDDELSEEYGTLLTEGGLWQYLSFATVLEALPIIWSNFSEVGITLGKSENSDSVSLKDMTYIEHHIRNQVEVLKESLIKYLNDHCDSFPLFAVSDCCQCACCGDKLGMAKPNPALQLYSPRRRRTTLK